MISSFTKNVYMLIISSNFSLILGKKDGILSMQEKRNAETIRNIEYLAMALVARSRALLAQKSLRYKDPILITNQSKCRG